MVTIHFNLRPKSKDWSLSGFGNVALFDRRRLRSAKPGLILLDQIETGFFLRSNDREFCNMKKSGRAPGLKCSEQIQKIKQGIDTRQG